MNYDLAIMALEGMARAPITVRSSEGEVTIEGPVASLKELARLLLLLASESGDETVELQRGVHVTTDSLTLSLRPR
ncbi:MAG: hypothetical protein ABI837_17205 [Acidobacteriota bacterium]